MQRSRVSHKSPERLSVVLLWRTPPSLCAYPQGMLPARRMCRRERVISFGVIATALVFVNFR